MDTIVVFIENENKHANLVASLNILDIPFIRLGEGIEWTSHFNKLKIYLDGLKLINNEWVLLSDSRDVLFYRGIDEINKIYKQFYEKFDIVVQAEDTDEGCVFFQETGLKRYSFTNSHYKYPCSGLMMGKRLAIIDFFEEVIEKVPEPWNIADQPAIEWGMYNLTHNISLDVDCRLFQQMNMGSSSGINFHLHFNKKFIKNTHTDSKPCVFHGAGGSFLHPVWRIINGYY
jgi:hypothetical protein